MEISLIEAFLPLLTKKKRIKSYYGGRGSGKSHEFAKALVVSAFLHGDKVLCGREFQNSIDDSVYAIIEASANDLGIHGFFDFQRDGIYGRNGSAFKFMGLARNIEAVKSKFGYTKVWIEEAETVSERSWDVLLPTIRAENSEIWLSWNPNESVSPTYQRFVAPYQQQLTNDGVYEDEYIYARKVSYLDNPFFPATLLQEMERDKNANYKKYLHIWMGECNADYDDSIIEAEWVDAAIDAHIKLKHRPRGERVVSFDPADSGKDAKALVKRYGMVIESADAWTTGDLDDAIARTFDVAFDYRADVLVYDAVGVGAGVKVGLADRVGSRAIGVVGFGGGDSPSPGRYKEDRLNEDVFRNKRAQSWWLLRDRFENTYKAVEKGEYFDPQDLISLSSDIKQIDLLKAELVRQQRKRSSSSRLIQLVSKDEMRSNGIPSPNMADALAMSFMLAPKKPKKKDHEIKPKQIFGFSGQSTNWLG